jgi:hypothetical protein
VSTDPRVGKICRPKPEIARHFTESPYVIRQVVPESNFPEMIVVESLSGLRLSRASDWLVPEMELVPA